MTDLRDRDDVIDRWLRRAASAPSGPGPNAACLDAEVMAAWADGGLSETALQAVRAHVADCARCQVLAAVMTKLEPVAAAAPEKSTSNRWLGWLVPLAAAAGAVAIWVFIPRPAPDFNQVVAPSAPAAQVAQAPAAEAVAAPQPEPKREAAAIDPQQAAKLRLDQQAAPKRQANEKDQFREAQAARAEPARDRAQVPADAKKADAKPAATVAQGTAPLPAPPPAPVAPPAAAAMPPPPNTMAQSTANRVAGGGGQGAGAGRAAGRGGGGGQRAEELADSRISKEIVSTDDSTRWRISAGVVEKSTDGGRTWTLVKTGVTAEFTAGASPSPTTCWLVGRSGLVLLTTDGQAWQRITFPADTDLSAIRATDARTATVTTLDGREYSTTDGGNTWIRR